MKNFGIKNAIVIFLMALMSVSAQAYEGKKSVSKSYNSSDVKSLKIENSFGEVRMVSGTGNTVEIDIEIIADGRDKAKVEKFINSIEIKFDLNKQESNLAVKTKNVSGNSSIKKFRINYLIKLPSDIALNINNDFGEVVMGSHNAETTFNLKHSTLTVSGAINAKCSVNLQHSHAKISDLTSVDISIQHSNMDIKSANSINLDCSFSDFDLGLLGKNIESNIQHSDISINKVESSVDNINIRAQFSDIKIALGKELSYTLQYQGQFSDYKNATSIQMEKDKIGDFERSFKGKNKDGKTNIKLKVQYSDVKIR